VGLSGRGRKALREKAEKLGMNELVLIDTILAHLLLEEEEMNSVEKSYLRLILKRGGTK
jgi:hypothetical protein